MPTAGTFMLDPRRPVLLVDGAGSTQRNTFYPAKIQTPADKRFWQRMRDIYRSRTTSPRTSVQLTPSDDGDFDPMSFQGAPDVLFDMFGALRGDQIVGPPEAFMPFTNIEASGSISLDNMPSSMSVDDDDEEEEDEDQDDDDILALVNFDSESSDEEMQAGSDATDTPSETPVRFPHISGKPSKKEGSQGDDLLAHLDRNRGLVGSFRRNQHFAKQIGSMASHPTARASTSELNAIQAGRKSAGNTPITPLRKKRIGKDVGIRNSPLMSPPSKGSINKRKGPVKGGFGGRR